MPHSCVFSILPGLLVWRSTDYSTRGTSTPNRLDGRCRIWLIMAGLNSWRRMNHTRPSHRLEKLLNLGCTLNELMAPEVVVAILDQFNEGNQKTPRMWAIDDQSFKKYSSDLLLNGFLICLGKQIQQGAREVLRMAVWISQLISNTIKEKVASLSIKIHGQILEDVHVRSVGDSAHRRG